MGKGRIRRVNFDLGNDTCRFLPGNAFEGEGIMETLAKHVSDEPLAFGSADIHGHGGNRGAAKFILNKYGPYLGTVAMGYNHFVTGT
jgi:hypothetical protein